MFFAIEFIGGVMRALTAMIFWTLVAAAGLAVLVIRALIALVRWHRTRPVTEVYRADGRAERPADHATPAVWYPAQIEASETGAYVPQREVSWQVG